MKKIRFISIALVTSLMLMGTGYAKWDDNLVINGTVATGEFNVNFVEDETYPAAKGSEYVTPSVEIVDEKAHAVQVSLTNLYPGAWAAFKVKGINSGTIPVKLDDIQVDFNGDKELLPYLTYDAGLTIDTNGDNVIDDGIEKFSGKLENIANDFNTKINSLSDVKLEPNGKGNFCLNTPEKGAVDLDGDGSTDKYIIIHFDEDAPLSTEKKTLIFNFTANFKQQN
ncbi:hypothetical protein G9F72_023155 [Clostridium estertheticum]|uniref:hypothetical protein n=1 Tax=Clostridium estertheticum TaxID=238834 RepID=UPI0013E95382|nr:hypothetical protein [Clostridium estertheticum]MBZ9689201.1 hypothetical protein [Clostridium estertheticum]